MERSYDDIKLVTISQKRFAQRPKNTVASAARLGLVGGGSHRDQIRKNNFLKNFMEEIVQRQAQLLQLTHDAILVRRFRDGQLCFGIVAPKNCMAGLRKRP